MTAQLVVELTKVTGERHRFTYHRPDGSGESLDLETRSYLAHDLLHFAVETQAGLTGSFYGLLARTQTYASLSEAGPDLGGEAGVAEMVVGGFTGLIKGVLGPEAAVAGVHTWLDAEGRAAPAWLTPAFAEAVAERFRSLIGEWRATPFGATMTLRFPI